MIESGQINKKEEEEKNIHKSKRMSFSHWKVLYMTILDITSKWESVEPANGYLRKFRNYEI